MLKIIKIFTILPLLVLMSCANGYKTSKHKTLILFKTEKYIYKINYPENWEILTSPPLREMERITVGDDYSEAIAAMMNDVPKTAVTDERGLFWGKAIGGRINIFVLDKDSEIYKKVITKDIENSMIDFSNFKNKKTSVELKKYISSAFNDGLYDADDRSLWVFFDIGENKVLFVLLEGFSHSMGYPYGGYTAEEKQQLVEEFYKIIHSLRRYNIR